MQRVRAVTFIGFDSAWTDNPKSPGAICSIEFDGRDYLDFAPPRLVRFENAFQFIRSRSTQDAPTLVALDQPTIVPNRIGMRPVEKVAATLVSWVGGGVQPANRGKVGMFDDDAPVWGFLERLAATEDPIRAKTAEAGLHLIEVFPALALPSLADEFFARRAAPRYNPGRKGFQIEDWRRTVAVVSDEAARLGCRPVMAWLAVLAPASSVTKADQDMLDAVICLLIAIRWRIDEPRASIMIGDLQHGYIVTPTSPVTRSRLEAAALSRGVSFSQG